LWINKKDYSTGLRLISIYYDKKLQPMNQGNQNIVWIDMIDGLTDNIALMRWWLLKYSLKHFFKNDYSAQTSKHFTNLHCLHE
jgi:hypothetical protein